MKLVMRKQEQLLYVCFCILLNLAHDERVRRTMVKRGIVKHLVPLLDRENAKLLLLVSSFLRYVRTPRLRQPFWLCVERKGGRGVASGTAAMASPFVVVCVSLLRTVHCACAGKPTRALPSCMAEMGRMGAVEKLAKFVPNNVEPLLRVSVLLFIFLGGRIEGCTPHCCLCDVLTSSCCCHAHVCLFYLFVLVAAGCTAAAVQLVL
mgnify:CR=1 FL=1